MALAVMLEVVLAVVLEMVLVLKKMSPDGAAGDGAES